MKTSNISGFYKMSINERLEIVKNFSDLTDEEITLLGNMGSIYKAAVAGPGLYIRGGLEFL